MGDWTSIVHRDLKLSNVFLSLPNERHYSLYLVPKLGDFGLAMVLPDGEVSDHDTQGTAAHMPIEQMPDRMRDLNESWPLTVKANVWGIANIVASLVTQQQGFIHLENLKDEHKEVWFDDECTNEYSAALLDLITRCMRFDPNNRPNLTRVLQEIRTRPFAQNVPLRHAGAYDPVWSAHVIRRDILDLVCMHRRQGKRFQLTNRSNKQSETVKRTYRPADPSDANYSTNIGGEAGTELAKEESEFF